MKKKVLLVLVAILAMGQSAFAYDFSAVAPSGQTLCYYTISNDAVSVYGSSDIAGSLTIPSTVNHNGVTYGVVSIGNYAFSGYSGLTSVTIPNSVTSIGDHAFEGCSGLTSVTIGNSVTSIGDWAFYNCSGLTSVNHTGTIAQWCNIVFSDPSSNPLCYSHSLNINGSPLTNLVIPNSVTSIGNYAFEGCSGLTSVTIGNSVTSIGWCAFNYCSGLTSVTIPNSVTSIGDYAFEGCSGLTSVSIPNSVTSISNYAFKGCSGLTSVTIPNSVTSIGFEAFKGCSGLTSVTIGSDVETIDNYALSGCTHLITITSRAEYPPICYGKTFDGVPAYADIIVPCGAKYRYEATDYWKDFSRITEDCSGIDDADLEGTLRIYPDDGRIVVQGAEGETVRVYDVTGRVLATKQDDYSPLRFDAPASGTYLIKIGSNPARRVVVIK